MFTDHLKLDNDSLISVFMPRETVEHSHQVYNILTKDITEKLHPFLAQFIENEKILSQIHQCKTIEQLESMRVNLIYPSLFADIVAELDKDERLLNDTERIFVLSRIADRMIDGAQQWITSSMHQRADAISRTPPGGKIVDLNGKKMSGGGKKIIT